MQPVKPYKLLQEQILESIFPLSLMSSPWNFVALVLVYFIWGLGLYILYPIPLLFFIYGSIAAIGISFWSFGIIKYANILRNTDVDKANDTNKRILTEFMEGLFNNYSLFYGIMLSTFGYAILLNPSFIKNDPYMLQLFNSVFGNFQFILNYTQRVTLIEYLSQQVGTSYLPLPILVYIFLLTFDICYRIGVSIHVTIQQMKRDYRLFKDLNNSKYKDDISPANIKSLLNADKYHIIALSGGFFLIPLGFYDKFLFFFMACILILSFFFFFLNLVFLDRLYVRSIPQAMKKILIHGKQGYISTISDKKRPHITPCTYVFDGRHIFFTTSMKSQKVTNLRKINRVAFYIELRHPYKLTKNETLLIQGKARIYGYNWSTSLLFVIFVGFKMLLIRNLFLRHFPDYIKNYKKNIRKIPKEWRITPIFSRTLVEIIPDKFLYSKGSLLLQTEF